MTTATMNELLDAVISSRPLSEALKELAALCHGKSDTIKEKHGDSKQAARWRRCGRYILTASAHVQNEGR